jgi:hypothetical protein
VPLPFYKRVTGCCIVCGLVFFMGCAIKTDVLPQFETLNVISPSELELVFSHEVVLKNIKLFPALPFTIAGRRVLLKNDTERGVWYTLSGEAALFNKTLYFKTYFQGYNSRPAKLTFNELTVLHSKRQPERIEFLVREEGSTAGITLYLGSAGEAAACFIFPDIEVRKGEYLVIVCRENTALPYDKKWLWPLDSGLPNKEGLLTLYPNTSSGAELMDGIAYFSGHEETSAAALWAKRHNIPFYDISQSTPTRSLSRQDNGTWLVTVTRGSTFGALNSRLPYKSPEKEGTE